jgi:GT2 family glycosyltransferase
MSTAVLVLSVDEAHHLRHCLPAIEGADEVVVIDNACSDDSALVAAQHGARVVTLPQRLSYAAAMNAGLEALDADAVLLLNADCVLDPGYLAAALPHLTGDVGSVAGKLLRVTGPGAEPDAIDAAGMWIDRRRKNGLVGHGAPITAYATRAECFGADGACALYRREALAGGFDEDMALWITDADLAWRARAAGWRSVYEPAATARHIRTYSPSKRAQSSEEHRRIQFRNRYLMMARNDTWRTLLRDLPRILVYEVLALGHVVLRERFLARGYLEAWRLRRGVRARRTNAVARVPFGLEPPREAPSPPPVPPAVTVSG